MRPLVLALTISTLGLVGLGCASTQTCRQQASVEYQNCTNPMWAEQSSTIEPTRSDQSQQCRESYHQTLTACGDVDPVAPVPDLSPRAKTSTRAANP